MRGPLLGAVSIDRRAINREMAGEEKSGRRGGNSGGAVRHEINLRAQIDFRANKGARDRASVVISRRKGSSAGWS